ncbi:MAG: STAS domain-containing protein [Planctomycetes bacterium]|nr:STAS domain-containing protein [Planctomycetota bacterium]
MSVAEQVVEIADSLRLTVLRDPARPLVAVVRFQGTLDAFTTAEADRVLARLVEEGRIHAVLSFAGLDFISSQGLGAVVASHKRCCDAGGDCVLSNLSSERRAVFEITQLTDYIDIYPDEEAALVAMTTG